jgi:hypothetical protein
VEGSGIVVVAGGAVGSIASVSNLVWGGDTRGICEIMVDPFFYGMLSSSTIVEYWSYSGGSSRIWMMGVLYGKWNEVESLESSGVV